MEKNQFIKEFNIIVDLINDEMDPSEGICVNVFRKIEGDFDCFYEYEQIEVAIDDENKLVLGGEKTDISIDDVETIDYEEVLVPPANGGSIFSAYGSSISILLSNGDKIRLIFNNDNDLSWEHVDKEGIIIRQSIDSNEYWLNTLTPSFDDGMTKKEFIETYNTIVDLFNNRSENYTFEYIANEKELCDDDYYYELAFDQNDKLILQYEKTKLSFSDIKKIVYRVHSQEDEESISLRLKDDRIIYLDVVGGCVEIYTHIPLDEIYEQ